MAAHWSDLDKELLVSAGTGVPSLNLLMRHEPSCCPGEEEVLNLLVPVARQVIPKPYAVPFVLCFQGISLMRD